MALMVCAFSFCLVMQFRQSPYELSAKPIDAIRLGDNVPGVNPEGDANEQPVIREQWRKITLRAHQTADNRLIEMELLRPVSWIEANSTDDGENVFVQFDELHFRGQAKIEAIEECPEIRSGPGRTVTGFFRHYASHVIDLKTDNGESIGVTPEHPFWSVDRQSFVDARTLKPGDRLKLLDGKTTTVAQATKRTSSEPVYNLEIQSSHVYHVAASGLLVHNAGELPCSITPGRVANEVHPDKFKYVFGEVTSNSHNTARSLQNVAHMNRVGIHNTAEGRRLLSQHLDDVVQNPKNVSQAFKKTLPDGSIIKLESRESLLQGPGGFVKIESTWEILSDGTRRLTTIIPFGG